MAGTALLIAPFVGEQFSKDFVHLFMHGRHFLLQRALHTFLLPSHSLKAVFPWRVLWTCSLCPDSSLVSRGVDEGGGFGKATFFAR